MTTVTITWDQYARKFLRRLTTVTGHRYPATLHNRQALMAWFQAEGGNARFNPFNTKMAMPGATEYNDVGVKNYPDLQTGIEANVKTLLARVKAYNYAPIRRDLRQSAIPEMTLWAVGDSAWGTVGSLALKVLPEVKDDYDSFGNKLIAT